MAVACSVPAASALSHSGTTTGVATAEADGAAQPVACNGYRCLDRDACFGFDGVASVTRLAHESSDCDAETAMLDTHKVAYVDRAGRLQRISVDDAQELMQCCYTTKLLFQSSTMLRNYPFWGYTSASSGGFESLCETQYPSPRVHDSVAIGHVASLEDVERTALGLFATAAIDDGALIGEYTGVVLVESSVSVEDASHDAYGICYQSVFEDGQLYLSALEYGNEIRCINHSFTPNVCFSPRIHDGILHVFCFATRRILAGEQLFVNYGPTYWKSAGITPLESF